MCKSYIVNKILKYYYVIILISLKYLVVKQVNIFHVKIIIGWLGTYNVNYILW